jgi:hypothetical protein
MGLKKMENIYRKKRTQLHMNYKKNNGTTPIKGKEENLTNNTVIQNF